MKPTRRAIALTAALLLAATLLPTAAQTAHAKDVIRLCPIVEGGPATVERTGGADRFEVAVHASERAFPDTRTDTQTQKLIEDVAAIDQRIAATSKPRAADGRDEERTA